ncbi:MAG TPA: DUF1501 domain-containing protein [Gemmataceae bacterium]|nr:DUF1501 domain-containing protein [Gemmataceae bacterium]
MQPRMNRRQMLCSLGNGFGALGLASVLAGEGLLGSSLQAATSGASNPLAPKAPHFTPRAKRVIFLFMNGGPSQVDTFDPKPALAKYKGETKEGTKRGKGGGKLLPSPFKFAKYGKSGIDVSELFPHVARCVDDLCVIRSMHTNTPNHEPSLLIMNSGESQPTRPSMGSWLSYGLGSENQNLPGYVVLCPGKPVVGPQLWSNSFLPGIYQGTHINNSRIDPKNIIQNVANSHLPRGAQRRQLDLLQQMNESHLQQRGQDAQLEARIASLEMAYRMQTEAQEAFDLTRETAPTRKQYGDGAFANACLIARRLAERGVRMTQIYYGNGQPWDDHGDILNHRNHARQSDQPIAALLHDLKARGLLDETLVLWGGEFGRTPASEGSKGRDHNSKGFTMWLAGGGIKGGIIHGATDEFGGTAVEKKVHVHDLHATILHLLGIDHERLTFRYSGRDFRLTDVHGEVVREILA